jgi:hypothetical protein
MESRLEILLMLNCIQDGQNNRNATDPVNISLIIWCLTNFCFQYSRNPPWNGLVQVLNILWWILYHSSWKTSSSCFRDVGSENLFLTLVSKTDQSGPMIFRCGDFFGQRKCWSSPSCSSNRGWTKFELCKWGHCHLRKLHRYSEVTSGSWDVPDYTQPDHVPRYSNSAMKGNNGTNRIVYHDIAAQTITEPPPCFMLEPNKALRIVGFLWCSPNVIIPALYSVIYVVWLVTPNKLTSRPI